jgi:sec-independent protein translocase protein TatB
MFDFSLGKLLLLALIALLVLGPDKLPGAARTVGAMVRRLRNGWDSVREEVEREFEIEEIRRTARKAAADAEATQAEASETLRRLHAEVEKARAEGLTGTVDTDGTPVASQSNKAEAGSAATDAALPESGHGND